MIYLSNRYTPTPQRRFLEITRLQKTSVGYLYPGPGLPCGVQKIRSFGQIFGRFKSIWICVNCQPLSVHPRHSKYKLCAANNLWTPQTPHFGSMTQLITAHTQRHQSNEIQRTTDKWTDADKQIPLMVITHN